MRTILPPLAFAGLLCVLGSALPAQDRGKLRCWSQTKDRVRLRILYPTQDPRKGFSFLGQVSIEYGPCMWKDKYEKDFDKLTRGRRWRFGTDFWTTMDTDRDLTIGGTRVPAGRYYLVLERTQGDQWSLVALDPGKVLARRYDAFQANATTGGIKAGLTWKQTKRSVEKLSVKLIPDEEDPRRLELVVAWGPHRLTAPVKVDV